MWVESLYKKQNIYAKSSIMHNLLFYSCGLMPTGLYKLSKQLEQSEVDQVANEIQGLVLLR
jgi:hypothetical protein